MGRSVFVDENVQTYIGELIKANKWFTGVIIGQVTPLRDYVIHIARTPEPVEDEAMEENGDGDSDSQERKPKPKVVRPKSMEQLDEKWVSTHAKQVCRMLPGGLSIIGLFVLAPTTMLQASQIKLKQMMYAVHKSLTKNPLLVPSSEITDRILLQIDSQTRKLTCTTLDVADPKSSPRPAEWKYQSVSSKWTRLETELSVDIPMTVTKDSKFQSSLLKQLQGGLSSFCESVRRAVVSIDGTIRDGSETLIAQTTGAGKGGKGGKGKGDHNEDSVVTKVKIFLPLPSSDTSSTATEEDKQQSIVSQSMSTLRMCGNVTVRAFVPIKATVDDAIQAVKMDAVRSLFARCELLCEEDNVTEDKEDSSVYDPPIRYFCTSPNSSADFCDYAFQDEKEEEMTQRIQELLDITVEKLEAVETNATEEDTWAYISSSQEDSDSVVSSHKDEATATGTVKAYLVAAMGGLVAIVASGISYLYLSD